VSSAVKLDLLERMHVSFDNSWHSAHCWGENISVQGKAVRDLGRIREQASKSVNWEHAVRTVVLQDATDRLNRLCVLRLLSSRVNVVQRIGIRWLPVREGKVNGHMHSDLAAAHDKVKKSHSFFHFEPLKHYFAF
jgi:hypothetical protein